MLEGILRQLFINAFTKLYGLESPVQQVNFQKTRPEFEGDVTIVVFPFVKMAKKSPEVMADEIGREIVAESEIVSKYNVVKGFLNLLVSDNYWLSFFAKNHNDEFFGRKQITGSPIVVEYSSPNTNKPLHLGHIRNNLLGWSVSEILRANGENVVRVNLVNDRGIHICKSMIAWQKWGEGCTPESTGKKGDHLIGDFYVLFDKHYKEEVKQLLPANYDELNDEEKEKASTSEVVYTTTAQVIYKMMELELITKKPTIKDTVDCLRFAINHNIVTRLDKTIDNMGAQIVILPTILFTISNEKINAIFQIMFNRNNENEEAKVEA